MSQKDDLISRQAALDVIFPYCPDDDGTCSKNGDDIRNLLDDIENLPSAQPEIIACGQGELVQDGLRLVQDCVDRQAAIDALEKVSELFPYRVPGNRDSYDRYNEAWNDAIGRAEIEIEALPSAQPSAQPEKHTEERTETHACDLISRKAAIDAVVGCTNCGTEDELRAYVTKHYLDNGWTGGIVDALDAIEQLSPAQPEPQWIPCSEKPAEVSCLACDEYGQVFIPEGGILKINGECYEGKGFNFDVKTFLQGIYVGHGLRILPRKIIAWMPLPEPYTEGREE